MLGCFRLILLLIFNIIVCESGHDELFRKTLHVPAETPLFNRNTMIINADSEQDNARVKRSSEPEGKSGNNNITVKVIATLVRIIFIAYLCFFTRTFFMLIADEAVTFVHI